MKCTRLAVVALTTLLTLCIFVSLSAAEGVFRVETSALTSLSNKELTKTATSSLGKGCQFFQPDSREVDMNTSSSSVLDDLVLYPLVAVKEQQVYLLVMKKSGDNWKVMTCSDSALQRPGFRLVGFSIDESTGANTMFNVYFDYLDETGREWTLTLTLSDIYPCWFSAVHTDNKEIILNYERGITYQLDYPSKYRCSYEIDINPAISFRLDEFSFALCPLEIQELLSPVDIRNKSINLFMYPDDTVESVFVLTGEETLDVIQQKDWSIAYYRDNMFYFRTSDIFITDD